MPSGLVGYWPLSDESAQDLSGNGLNGTLNGGVTTGVAGRGGLEAMSLDGSNDYISYSNSSELSNDNNTWSIWFKSPTAGTPSDLRGVLFKGPSTSGGDREVSIVIDTDGIVSATISDGTSLTQVKTRNNYYDAKWHLSTVVKEFDGTEYTLKLYIDGELIGSTVIGTTVETNSAALESGRVAPDSPSSRYFGGSIAECRVYNRALSEREIQTLYEWGSADLAQPPGASDNGIAYYPLDGDATDSFGTNDGTINGATFVQDDVIRGQAADFDGVDDYITLPTIFSSTPSEATVSLWANWDAFSTANSDRDALIDLRTNAGIVIRDDNTTNENVEFLLDDGSFQVLGPFTDVSANSWFHLCFSIGSNTAIAYINGVRVGSLSHNGLSGRSENVNELGTGSSTSQFFDGKIDDVRIYDRALSPSEVFELYRWGTRGRDMREYTVNL